MFKDVIGFTHTPTEYDALTAERFTLKHLKGESQLQQTCWFDYRFMHPMKRTYLFAHYFVKNFKALYEEKVDMNSSKVFGVSRPKDPLDNRPAVNKTNKLTMPTYLWNARRCADFLSVPYDVYCEIACREAMRIKGNDVAVGAMRSSKGDGKLLLSASNIYDEHVVGVVTHKWQERQKFLTLQAKDGFYRNGDFSHPYMLEYEKYLVKQAYAKHNPEFILSQLLSKGSVREVVAGKIFDERIILAAKAILQSNKT